MMDDFEIANTGDGITCDVISSKPEPTPFDPKNNDKSEVALRFNKGKTRYELIPTHLLKSTADVFEYGANKYSTWNWAKRGMSISTIIGCIKRHLAALEIGEDIDPESKLPHVGHLGCNLLMLEHAFNILKDHPEMDDRPTKWFSKTT